MAEDTQTPADKAAVVQGAGPDDLDPATGGSGNPAPPEPPKNRAEADKANPPAPDPEAEAKAKAEAEAKEKADADAAAEKAKADEEAKNRPLDTEVWGSTGDEVGDAALNLIQNAGLTPDEAKALMFDAVSAGKPEDIDVAALTEKVGKNQATLIMAGVRDFVTRNNAKAATIVAECHTSVGGKDNWDAVTTWANKHVSAEELSDYRELIDMGGAKARFAAQELAARFNSDGNNTTLDAGGEIVGDNAAPSSARALSKADYFAEMDAAHSRGATPAEIQEIKAARQRGRTKGI